MSCLRLSRSPRPDLKEIERAVARARENSRSPASAGTAAVDCTRGATSIFLTESLDQVKRVLHEQFSERGDITPAMFRDHFNTTRNTRSAAGRTLTGKASSEGREARRLKTAGSTAKQERRSGSVGMMKVRTARKPSRWADSTGRGAAARRSSAGRLGAGAARHPALRVA